MRRLPRPQPRLNLSIAARIAAAILVAAALVGCGGSSSGGGQTTSSPQLPTHLDTSSLKLAGGAKAVWGSPLGNQSAKGLLILIHGGSWKGIDPVAFRDMLGTAPVYRQLGFETLTVDYRAGAAGLTDLSHIYHVARQRVGAHFPICAVGVSAGGHLALMLAVRNPDLTCVISLAGPTNLPAFRTEPNGASGYQIATGAFGSSVLAQLSPALHARAIKAKLLLIYARTDRLVPVQQGEDMAQADPRAKLIVLPGGSAPFVHTGINGPVQATGVDPGANANAQQAQVTFLNSIAGRG
jgi:dienelactone hydrolase